MKINGRTYSKPAGDGIYSKKSAAVIADAPKQEPAKPVDAKLVKWANILAVTAVILGTVRFAARCIDLSIVNGVYEFAMLLVAAGAVKGIRKGKYRAGALMRVPAAMLGYDAFAVIIPFFFGLGRFSVPDLVPLLRDVLLILMLVFMKKELQGGKTIKTKIVTGLLMLYHFGLGNMLCYLADKADTPEIDRAFSAARYGTSPVNAFFGNIRGLFGDPTAPFKNNPGDGIADAFKYSLSRYFFLITLLILTALMLMLIAVGRGEVEKSADMEKTGNKGVIIICLAASIGVLLGSYAIGWLAPSTGGGGSGRGPGSTCMADGCDRPAVGPYYEFCSWHKDLLEVYWNNENRN